MNMGERAAPSLMYGPGPRDFALMRPTRKIQPDYESEPRGLLLERRLSLLGVMQVEEREGQAGGEDREHGWIEAEVSIVITAASYHPGQWQIMGHMGI